MEYLTIKEAREIWQKNLRSVLTVLGVYLPGGDFKGPLLYKAPCFLHGNGEK